MLKGTLDDFTLPDVFRLMSFAKKTGRLDVVRSAGQGKVFFRDGEVYFAESSLSKEPLGQKLVRARALTDGQLMKALDQHAASGERLGTVLIKSGVVTEEQLESAVRQQIEDSIFDLLRWELGEFGWEPNIQLDVEVHIGVSVENLIMEASRRLDEFEVIKRKIPSGAAILGMAATPPEGAVEINITPDEWRVLVLVDGHRSVNDIAGMVGLDEFGAMRVLYGLVSAGLIELISEGTVDEPAAAEPVAAVRSEERPAADAVANVVTEEAVTPPRQVEEPPAQPIRTVVTADLPELAEVVEPEPAPEPVVEPEPIAVAEPEPVPAAEPGPAPEPVAVAEPEPAEEPEPVMQAPEPEPVMQEPEPIMEAPEPTAEPESAQAAADPFADLGFDTPAVEATARDAPTVPAPSEEPSSIDEVFASFGLLDDATNNGMDAPSPAAIEEPSQLDSDDLAAFGIAPIGPGTTTEQPAADEPAWPEPAAIESFDAPQPDELVTSTPEPDPFVSDLFSEPATTPAAEEPPAPPAPAPVEPEMPVSSAPSGEAPSVDRAAVVRELAGLFGDEDRPRSRPAGPRPDNTAEDARKRVEDDDQVTKGIISRLIDGVKGL
ncbi:MAG TPA: DUF4388 domain-containing protein [Actinomycetota bacterium]|nr:DUF4388 domain-containing protein [Actinomycetota bacterium]